MDSGLAPRGIDVTKAHPARRYNYWLGGKDNFAADRESADMVAGAFPTVRLAAQENRRFLHRAVTHLSATAGIRQFLDIGTGLPSAGNVHEIAQAIAPQSRVVYVDNDPIVLVHARALLKSAPEGATAYLDADIRSPERILHHPDLLRTLDMTQPVALMLVAVMHFITDHQQAYDLVRQLTATLPSGSYLVITHATSDHLTPEELAATEEANQRSGVPFALRSTEEFSAFFTGFDLVEPGITSVVQWRPTVPEAHRPDVADVSMLCGMSHI